MATRLNPYLGFRDNAREAITFYHSVFGGELVINTFAEMQASENPDDQDKVMHSMLTTDTGMVLMASDAPTGMEPDSGSTISISLSGEDEAELRGYWDKLSGEGNTVLPLEKAPWGDYFGMCVDQFGISWMVNIAGTTADLTAMEQQASA